MKPLFIVGQIIRRRNKRKNPSIYINKEKEMKSLEHIIRDKLEGKEELKEFAPPEAATMAGDMAWSTAGKIAGKSALSALKVPAPGMLGPAATAATVFFDPSAAGGQNPVSRFDDEMSPDKQAQIKDFQNSKSNSTVAPMTDVLKGPQLRVKTDTTPTPAAPATPQEYGKNSDKTNAIPGVSDGLDNPTQVAPGAAVKTSSPTPQTINIPGATTAAPSTTSTQAASIATTATASDTGSESSGEEGSSKFPSLGLGGGIVGSTVDTTKKPGTMATKTSSGNPKPVKEESENLEELSKDKLTKYSDDAWKPSNGKSSQEIRNDKRVKGRVMAAKKLFGKAKVNATEEVVDEEAGVSKGTEIRTKIKYVPRLTKEKPTDEKSKLGRLAAYKTNVIDEEIKSTMTRVIKKAKDKEDGGEKEEKKECGKNPQVDLHPTLNNINPADGTEIKGTK